MSILTEIAKKVKSGKCILFLGAMASATSPDESDFHYRKAPPSGKELSRRLADRCGCPDKENKNDLIRISLIYEHKRGRPALIDAIKEMITKDKDTGEEFVPSPALQMLADLPFPIVITTNYDRLFDVALYRANTMDGTPKKPNVIVYNPDPKAKPEFIPLDIEESEPVLMKLHGSIDKSETIVVTEEDYIDFIRRMSDPAHHPLPMNLRSRLTTWPLLFIGYSLRDYNLRLLFKTLDLYVPAGLPRSYSVDPTPDDVIVSLMRGKTVHFIEENLWTFVPKLYKQVKRKEYGYE